MTSALFSALRTALGLRLLTAVVTLFRQFTTWSPADEAVFAAQVLPFVQGSQRALASLTAVHVATQASEALGRPIGPPGIPDTASVDLRRGVSPAAPYRRVFVTVRFKISRGETPQRAAEIGEDRLRRTADMDLQQTYAESSRAAMEALPEPDRPKGWQRVPTGANTCPLCLVAASKLYDVEERSPLHARCDCLIQPVYDITTPVNWGAIDQAIAAAAELSRRAAAGEAPPDDPTGMVERVTQYHGEYGPVLRRPDYVIRRKPDDARE